MNKALSLYHQLQEGKMTLQQAQLCCLHSPQLVLSNYLEPVEGNGSGCCDLSSFWPWLGRIGVTEIGVIRILEFALVMHIPK